jgi:hypothetical protein
MGGGIIMGKHHRKWYIDEPIASNKRVDDMMDDLEEFYEEPEEFRPEHLKRMGISMTKGGENEV